jgi:hypothetical protein
VSTSSARDSRESSCRQLVGQLFGFHRLDRNRLAPIGSGAAEQRLQKRMRRDLLAAKTEQRENRRRGGRPEQLVEQHRAVRVRPVQVVDVEHHRIAIGNRRQQFVERPERATPQDQRIDAVVQRR